MSDQDVKNVYQRINLVMRDCEYVQKKSAQQGKGVKYDEVIAMLRALLIKHGLVIVVRQLSLELLDGVEGTKQKIYQGSYEMDIVNIDNPEDKVTHTAFAHGMDGGDKAPGKAHTYAVKIMLVKGFGIETGEDEESRSEKLDKLNTIDENQIGEIWPYLVDGEQWTQKAMKIFKAYKISKIEDLPESKFKEVMKLCTS